jgi:Ca2+-binding RTX toxin-like protein
MHMSRSLSHIDSLEPRRLLSSANLSIDGQLTVTGNSTGDTVTLQVVPNTISSGLNLKISINSETPREFSLASLAQVRMFLLGGNDTLTVNESGGKIPVKLVIFGGAGKDTINCGSENDDVRGEGDADRINGGEGKNVLRGGDANDKLTGGNNRDVIYGDAGDDTIFAKGGKNVVRGGDGNDVINGGDDSETLDGGAGNDSILANGGNDSVVGRDGNDTLVGGDGNDVLWGIVGADNLQGGNGNDTIWGGLNNDVINGGSGSNKLHQGEDSAIESILKTIDAITS